MVHSPRASTISFSSSVAQQQQLGQCGSGGGKDAAGKASCSSGNGWRQHFQATMKAFDERHNKLQQELSGLRREAFQLGE
jgi:hypothetical protein